MSGLVQFGEATIVADVDYQVFTTSVAGLTDGGYAVSWYRSYQTGVPQILTQMVGGNGALIDQNGATEGTAFIMPFAGPMTSFGQGEDKIAALTTGGYVVAYTDSTYADGSSHDNRVTYQLFDAAGSATATGFVPSGTEWTTGHDVTSTPDGGFAISYIRYNGGFPLVLFKNGVGNLEEIPGASGHPTSLDTLGDGYVLTWQDFNNGTIDIFGAIADATGQVGPTFPVNTITTGDQSFNIAMHSVEELAGGGFVVVWKDESGTPGGFGADVFAKLFDAAGDVVKDDFFVNTTTAGHQTAPEVLALDDGGFAVVWRDDVNAVLQVFDAAGEKRGGESSVLIGGAGGTFGISQIENGQLILSYYATANGAIYTQTFLVTQDGTEVTDVMNGTGNPESFDGLEGDDVLNGKGGADVLAGGEGNDTINGGAGDDKMTGGNGDDIYYVASTGDVVIEGAGEGAADLIAGLTSYTMGASTEVETLRTTSNGGTVSIDLTGNALKQTITGNAGANVLSTGGGAADTLQGLGGDDTYRIYNANDTIVETTSFTGGTADRVAAAVDYVLKANVGVEIMSTNGATGTSGIDLTGNALKQSITGNAGANMLHDGGAGAADTMSGLAGNDTYRVFNAGDVIVESTAAAGGLADRVAAAVDYVLKANVGVETMTTNGSTGKSGIDLTGNEAAQTITGNDGSNILDGQGGVDTLSGLGGKDFFVFSTAIDGGNVDVLADFNVADDTIRLENAIFTALTVTGTLTAAAFRANTTGAAEGDDDRIIYDSDDGKLFYDANGVGGAAGIHFATVGTGLTLTNADFVIV